MGMNLGMGLTLGSRRRRSQSVAGTLTDLGASAWYSASDITANGQASVTNRLNDAKVLTLVGAVRAHPRHNVYFPNSSNTVKAVGVTLPAGDVTRLTVRKGPNAAGTFAQIYGPDNARMHLNLAAGTNTFTTTETGSATSRTTVTTITGSHTAKWVQAEFDTDTDTVRARNSDTDTYDPDEVVWGSWSTVGSPTGGIKPTTGTATIYFYGTDNEAFYAEVEVDGTLALLFDPTTQIDVSSDPDAGQSTFSGWTVNRSGAGHRTMVVTRPTIGVTAGDAFTLPDTPSNQYVLARTWGGDLELKSSVDVEAGTFEGEITDILDFSSPLDPGEIATVEGLLL